MSNDTWYGSTPVPKAMKSSNSFATASKDFKKLNPSLCAAAPPIEQDTKETGKNAVAGILDAGNGHVVKVHNPKGMNKHEAEYGLMLEAMKRRDEIAWYGYETIRLKLADRTTYTPDFCVVVEGRNGCHPAGIPKFIEIKGFRRDDAMVKFKVAREQFWWASFEMWSKTKNGWRQIL